MQRSISKGLETHGVGTKSQQALKLQQEEGALTRKQMKRDHKEQEKNAQFAV